MSRNLRCFSSYKIYIYVFQLVPHLSILLNLLKIFSSYIIYTYLYIHFYSQLKDPNVADKIINIELAYNNLVLLILACFCKNFRGYAIFVTEIYMWYDPRIQGILRDRFVNLSNHLAFPMTWALHISEKSLHQQIKDLIFL